MFGIAQSVCEDLPNCAQYGHKVCYNSICIMFLGAGGECGDRDDTVGINKFCVSKLHFQNGAENSVPICGKQMSS